MNCKQVQDLIPLYAGSDLEERRARLVAAHVQICETCSGAAREYRETRQLLQTFAPPEFTENFYAEMRQRVWQNIEKKSSAPARIGIIEGLFRPRLAWALATGVLIAVSIVGFYLTGRLGVVRQPVVSHQPPTTPTTKGKQVATASDNDASSARSLASGSNSRLASVHQPDLRQKRKATHDRVNLAAVPAVAVLPAASSAPEPGDSRPPSYASSDAVQVPLRLEIQTKNPNIRIIWFTHREAKSSSPNSRGI
jgi:hypothetical protein